MEDLFDRILDRTRSRLDIPAIRTLFGLKARLPVNTGLLEPLRVVDLARKEMEGLAERHATECIASTRLAEQVVTIGSTGKPRNGGFGTRIGQRMPFVAPLGAVFAAWAGEAGSTSWVLRAGGSGRLTAD